MGTDSGAASAAGTGLSAGTGSGAVPAADTDLSAGTDSEAARAADTESEVSAQVRESVLVQEQVQA